MQEWAEAHSTADQVLCWDWEVHVSHGQRGIKTEALPDGGSPSYPGMACTLCVPAQSQATPCIQLVFILACKIEASKTIALGLPELGQGSHLAV